MRYTSKVQEKRLQELITLNEVGTLLNASPNFNDAITTVLEKLIDTLDLSSAWLFLSKIDSGDSYKGRFSYAASANLPPVLSERNCHALKEDGCECQSALKRGELDHGINMVSCSRLSSNEGDKAGLDVHASIPLLTQNGPEGILNLAKVGQSSFDAASLDFFTAIGQQLGTAFERSRLQDKQLNEAVYVAALEQKEHLLADMHDSVAQLLFAADLSIQVAQSSDTAAQNSAAVNKTASLIQSAVAELRQLMEAHKPSYLSSGLKQALRRLVSRFNTSVNIHLEADDVEMQEDEVFFRIAQEALQNSLRHSKANNIWIRLENKHKGILLLIEDDGIGFDSQETEGLGIRSMKDRSQSINAKFTLESNSEGSRLSLFLAHEENHES